MGIWDLYGKFVPRRVYRVMAEPPPFVGWGKIKADEVQDLFHQVFRHYPQKSREDYQIPDLDCLKAYCRWWPKLNDWMEYKEDFITCVNFTNAFIGDMSKWDMWCDAAKMIYWGGPDAKWQHAFPLFIAYNEKTEQIEVWKLMYPQSGCLEKCEPGEFYSWIKQRITLE